MYVELDVTGMAQHDLMLVVDVGRLGVGCVCVLAGPANPSTGAILFKGALDGGGQALGVATGIAGGVSADFLELDRTAATLASREQDALLDSWLFSGRSREIKTVWRAGVRVVDGGRHIHRERVERRYGAVLGRLLA